MSRAVLSLGFSVNVEPEDKTDTCGGQTAGWRMSTETEGTIRIGLTQCHALHLAT